MPGARDRDNRMSDARRRVDWEACSPGARSGQGAPLLRALRPRPTAPAPCAARCARCAP
ncbi:MAG: hypothetical protein ACLSGS_12550 [Adlercreutzia sp.]